MPKSPMKRGGGCEKGDHSRVKMASKWVMHNCVKETIIEWTAGVVGPAPRCRDQIRLGPRETERLAAVTIFLDECSRT